MSFDIALSIVGGLCVLAGIIGCIVPVLPGPVLCFSGLVILQFTSDSPFTPALLTIYAALTIVVAVLDYVIPVYGTKKLEGSKYGIWGCTAGLVLGVLFFFPVGIILGPMAGAFLGELLSGKNLKRALKSAVGSFLGFLASALLKIALSVAMAYHFSRAVYDLFFL
jgi:uncharacterized protein YqgC (DUF456 family)